MNRNRALKTSVITAVAALTLAGQASGQTATASSTISPRTSARVLAQICAEADIIPLDLYPPGYLDHLQSLGDSPYPPPEVATASPVMAHFAKPMVSQTPPASFYEVLDLGSLGSGNRSYANSINGSGTTAGYAAIDSSQNDDHAFQYSGNPMTDIALVTEGIEFWWAYGINNEGQVVGGGSVLADNNLEHALCYMYGSVQDLTPGLSYNCVATSVNSSGQVAGYCYPPIVIEGTGSGSGDTSSGQQNDAFLMTSGVMKDLGSINGFNSSTAFGVNDAGKVIGSSTDANNDVHAFAYSGNGPMVDLDSALGGNNYSVAYGINNNDQIVGVSQNAFVYSLDNGLMTDLGNLGDPENQSTGLGINNNGDAVGSIYIPAYNGNDAFVCPSGGTMEDLNNLIDPNSYWILEAAEAINDNGQIVGYGFNPDGYEHAFLLDPFVTWTYTGYPQGDLDTSKVPTEFGNDTALSYAIENHESTTGYGSDGKATTVAYGCALCSVSAMLTTMPGFESMTPKALNDDLNSTAHGYEDGCEMGWGKVREATGCPVDCIDSRQISNSPELEQYLDDHCWGNRYRVILELNAVENGGKPESHYVLVVGKTADDWIVFDPGWASAYVNGVKDDQVLSSLNAHYSGFSTYSASGQKLNSWQFTVIGVVTYQVNSPLNGSIANIAHSPVELLVTDPNGNEVGYNPVSGTDTFEIPGSSYIRGFPIMNADDDSGSPAGDTNGIKYLYIPSPVGGTYTTTLIGTAAGEYTLDSSIVWPGNSEVDQTVTGTTDVGVISTNSIFVIVPSIVTANSLNNGVFTLSFTTQTNVTYVLEGADSLTSADWTELQTIMATGVVMTVSQSATNPMMFYRVESQ